jgi:predicted RNA-binding Zn-ribbon protein involved in translation (DUF1610 family)
MKIREVDPSSWGFYGKMRNLYSAFHCPICGQLFEFKKGTNDEVMKCPECGHEKII